MQAITVQLDSGALVALGMYLLTQLGALVWFAASVTENLKHLNLRAGKCENIDKVVIQLAAKEGIEV